MYQMYIVVLPVRGLPSCWQVSTNMLVPLQTLDLHVSARPVYP